MFTAGQKLSPKILESNGVFRPIGYPLGQFPTRRHIAFQDFIKVLTGYLEIVRHPGFTDAFKFDVVFQFHAL